MPSINTKSKYFNKQIPFLLASGKFKNCPTCNTPKPIKEFPRKKYKTGSCSKCSLKIYMNNYRQTPRAKVLRKATNAIRRSLVNNAKGKFTKDEFLLRCKVYDGLCYICQKNEAIVPDHVIPLSKGGTNFPANIRGACNFCNSRKHNNWWGVNRYKEFLEWLRRP